MILCGDTAAGKGERDGACAGSPPERKLGGRSRREKRVKKISYVTISDGA